MTDEGRRAARITIVKLKKSIMPVFVKVYQNQIKNSPARGKWYGRVVATKTMSYAALCQHISEHNSVYGEDVCLGVANKLQSCILEQLLEGKKVQFGALGTFFLKAKGSGTETEEAFNLGKNIDGLYLCFAPSRMELNNLTSKMLKKKASLKNVKDLTESKGKKKDDDEEDDIQGGETGGNNGGNTPVVPSDEPDYDQPSGD